jgi:helix-turn-helix protein
MGEQPALQAASVRQTARIFSIPARALYSAVRANELQAFCPSGRRAVILFDDVRAWLRKHPAPSRMKQTNGDTHAPAS